MVARSGCTRGSVGCRASSTRAAAIIQRAQGMETRAVAFPGIRHLGFSQSVEPVFHGLAGPVSRNCSEGCAVRMGDDARGATGLLSRSERAGHSGRAHVRFCQPEQRCRSTERTGGSWRIASHVPVDRPPARVREQHGHRRLRHARSRRLGCGICRCVAYPNNGFAIALRTVAGSIVRGAGRACVSADRRFRHSRHSGSAGWRHVWRADGDLR